MKEPNLVVDYAKQIAALEKQLAKAEVKLAQKRNVRGKNGEEARGAWCTDRITAAAVGPWDVDPFSNPRSHIVSTERCMLEDGGDGFGDGTPGSYRCGATGELKRATEDTRLWGQPDYSFVTKAFEHYQHTRWCWLLRFDPRPAWMKRIYRQSALVIVLWDCNFEPPPGVVPSSSTFPHALYYRNAADATPAILRRGIAWRTGNR